MERFTFFWSGPFSQWYLARFVVDGVRYNCAEQYMMAGKARLFGDEKTERAIMSCSDPKAQKAHGRDVKPFNAQKWDNVSPEVVYAGNYAKFTQNADLKALLLETVGTTLVEASPYDKLWGIGLSASDPRAKTRSTWKGKTGLGETLTRLRDDLIKESR